MQDIFSRTAMLLGRDGLERLGGCRGVVAGGGGVGSYTAEALARGGVGHLRLIDHDTIAPSNINRQLHATGNTVGLPKAETMAGRLRDINPALEAEAVPCFLTAENTPSLLEGHWDYIVDAVDNVTAKIALAKEAARRGIPIISSMGTGNKLDPSRFQVADIYATSVCPLCRVMRRELRRAGIPALTVVFSTEEPRTPFPTAGDGAERRATPGSVSFVPGVAGLIAAGVVIRALAGIG